VKAAIHYEHGPAGVVRVEEVPDPECGPGEVLIAVRAASLNRLDVLQREGPPLLPGFSLPHIAGMDVAGEVVATGSGVESLAVGDRVVVNPAVHCGTCEVCLSGDDGMCPQTRVVGGNAPGGFAEHVVVPASHVYRVPQGVDWARAAAMPTNYSTSWHALVVTGRLSIGETVLIHGAGSGITLAGIQVAKAAGARVVVSSGSDEKLAVAERVGADVLVNHSAGNLVEQVRAATGGRGVDMVLDHVGPALFQQSIYCIRPRGRMVFCGTTTGTQATFSLPFAYHFGISLLGADPYSHAEFERMLEYCWRFDPVIDSEFSLADIRPAMERMEKGESIGKIVVRP
jgi:NADPH:quinone reductase-like Zn-dependent oxidoreductase